MESSAATTVEQPSENWFRRLKDDRLEVCLKADGLRLRASGSEAEVWQLVELFEELSGLAVEGEWRRPPRTGSRPLDGQLTMDDLELRVETS